jgi:Ca-activated chloride channel family protein
MLPSPRVPHTAFAFSRLPFYSAFVTNSSRFFLASLVLLSFTTTNLRAQGSADEEAPDKTLSPYFVVLSDDPAVDNLPLKETSANVNIVGVIADVTVKQVYVNNGKNKLEAIYTFPLSTKAAVYAMEMTIGSRVITAKIEEKKKAKEQYEQAKKEGKRTSLLEQSRPNVFTMNVANIMVGDTIKVEVKYTELLVPENGRYSFVYPTVVGPRYSNKQKEGASGDDEFVNTPFTKEGVMPTYRFGMDISIHSGLPIQDVVCRTHKTVITHPDLTSAHITLDPSEKNGGNRDLIVEYSLQGDKISSGVMLYEHGDENFFLMMVQPPKKIAKEEIPPREYIFIVDVSGSMWGFPLDISKKLLRNLLVNLKPTDKFNLVLFSGFSATLAPRSIDATQANVDKAIKLIDAQKGGGGTELMQALQTAYAIPRADEDISRSFVIVSDGYIDVEKEAFDFVRTNSGNTNFFSFGIGSSVNRYLMEGLAFMGSGEAMIVTKPELADGQAEKFRKYINTPVLTRIKPQFGKFTAYDVEPMAPPDMMAERPIIVFGKYKGKNSGIVTVSGKAGRQAYSQSFDISKVKPEESNSALRYLWAREKIKLLDYVAKSDNFNGEDTTVPTQIRDLGLKYNLMTNYTSFIAIDEQIVKDSTGKLVRVKQPNPLPEGVSNFAVGYDAPGLTGQSGDVYFGGGRRAFSKSRVASDVSAFDSEEEIIDSSAVTTAQPSFPGGEDSLRAFIAKNLVYPESARRQGITGTVIVTFIVQKDGRIMDVAIQTSVNKELDEAAMRLIAKMPKWIPGGVSGVAQDRRVILPIKFGQ